MSAAPSLDRIGNVQLPEPFVSSGKGLAMVELAYLHNNPDHALRQIVKVPCSQQCGTEIEAMAYFSSVTACNACREKAIEAMLHERMRAYWESICPADYRDTKLAHPDWPKAQYEELKEWKGDRSLFFYGPTGAGKTRLAFILIKRALVHCNKTVGVMFDKHVADAKASRERLIALKNWSRFDVLLLDDCLLNGSQDEHTVSFMKSLLEDVMNEKRVVIITSQINFEEYKEQQGKYAKEGKGTTAADSNRTSALLRRIKEMCGAPIVFHSVKKPEAGQEPF